MFAKKVLCLSKMHLVSTYRSFGTIENSPTLKDFSLHSTAGKNTKRNIGLQFWEVTSKGKDNIFLEKKILSGVEPEE